jgi:hypothetical protein
MSCHVSPKSGHPPPCRPSIFRCYLPNGRIPGMRQNSTPHSAENSDPTFQPSREISHPTIQPESDFSISQVRLLIFPQTGVAAVRYRHGLTSGGAASCRLSSFTTKDNEAKVVYITSLPALPVLWCAGAFPLQHGKHHRHCRSCIVSDNGVEVAARKTARINVSRPAAKPLARNRRRLRGLARPADGFAQHVGLLPTVGLGVVCVAPAPQ